jgi:hypothetical protein
MSGPARRRPGPVRETVRFHTASGSDPSRPNIRGCAGGGPAWPLPVEGPSRAPSPPGSDPGLGAKPDRARIDSDTCRLGHAGTRARARLPSAPWPGRARAATPLPPHLRRAACSRRREQRAPLSAAHAADTRAAIARAARRRRARCCRGALRRRERRGCQCAAAVTRAAAVASTAVTRSSMTDLKKCRCINDPSEEESIR